jgi:hypothetical protein
MLVATDGDGYPAHLAGSQSGFTVNELKGPALQLIDDLDFLSIEAYRLLMEHPSRKKGEKE